MDGRSGATGAILIALLASGCRTGGSAPSVDAGNDGPVTDSPDEQQSREAAPDSFRDGASDAPRDPIGSDTPPTLGVGRPCANDQACGPGQVCADEATGWWSEGYCTLRCQQDDDCGADSFCSAPFPTGNSICLLRCDGGGGCSNPTHRCSRFVAGTIDFGRNGCFRVNDTATDGAACKTFADCRGTQGCYSNPFNAPGGVCMTAECAPGDDSTCAPEGDGMCFAVGTWTTGLCYDQCTAPSDCRTSEGYKCIPYLGSAFCTFPLLASGDPCDVDAQCGPPPWQCLTGASFPSGYCGARGCTAAVASTCPYGAVCHDPDPAVADDQYCVKECSGDSDCRTGGGYFCKPLADVPMVKGCKL